MEISIVTVSRVFKIYQGQVRIAELNSKNPVKRTQGQRDHVSISSEAKAAFTKHAMENLLTQLRSSQAVQAEKVTIKNMEAQNVQTEEIEKKKDEGSTSKILAG
jgi:hypothetical protein